MRIVIEKSARQLTLLGDGEEVLLRCPIALGFSPAGQKERAGDGKTPEGTYYVCLRKQGKYGPALGISYPGEADARRLGAEEQLIACIRQRAAQKERPPWGTALGGEIFIHGGGTGRDWTAGCIALSDDDAAFLYARVPLGLSVCIRR